MKFWNNLFTKKTELNALKLHVAGAMIGHTSPFADLIIPVNEERVSKDVIDKWVLPFYLKGLADVSETTMTQYIEASNEITPNIVANLLGDFNWRTRICGSYFAAINSYKEFEPSIGNLLLKSEVCYAGRGYCLALSSFKTDASKMFLEKYLDYYLDKSDLWFDQAEAYCALEYLDAAAAKKFDNKWLSFISDKPSWTLEGSRNYFNKQMSTIQSIRQSLASKN